MKVLNKRKLNGERGVYVGRPSKFGNPFALKDEADREEVIRKFEAYFLSNESLKEQAKKELTGKNLICWCAPKRCHADVILKFLEEGE